jgi:hypothetical protein
MRRIHSLRTRLLATVLGLGLAAVVAGAVGVAADPQHSRSATVGSHGAAFGQELDWNNTTPGSVTPTPAVD